MNLHLRLKLLLLAAVFTFACLSLTVAAVQNLPKPKTEVVSQMGENPSPSTFETCVPYRVNVRTGAGMQNAVIDELANGVSVEIIGKAFDRFDYEWKTVQYTNADGETVTGSIYSKYICEVTK